MRSLLVFFCSVTLCLGQQSLGLRNTALVARSTPAASSSPTFVAASNSNGTTIAVPSGTANGHMMVAFVGSETPGSISTPSGWTKVGSTFTWGAGLGYGAALFWRVASSEPANYQFCNSTYRFGFIVTYSGASSIDVSGSIVDLTGSSMTLPGITSSSGSMLLSFIHDRDPGITFTPPTGMTERLDADSATYWRVGAAELLNANNSDRTWTASSNFWPAVGVLVSIK